MGFFFILNQGIYPAEFYKCPAKNNICWQTIALLRVLLEWMWDCMPGGNDQHLLVLISPSVQPVFSIIKKIKRVRGEDLIMIRTCTTVIVSSTLDGRLPQKHLWSFDTIALRRIEEAILQSSALIGLDTVRSQSTQSVTRFPNFIKMRFEGKGCRRRLYLTNCTRHICASLLRPDAGTAALRSAATAIAANLIAGIMCDCSSDFQRF